MRTTKDRIRHTILFEVIAIVLGTLIAKIVLQKPLSTLGPLTMGMSLLAMTWNYSYNWAFDQWQQKFHKAVAMIDRSLQTRLVHALGFEGGFLLLSVPLMAWWLSMTLWQALLMDLGFAAFFMAYAFVFNWTYDTIFLRKAKPVTP